MTVDQTLFTTALLDPEQAIPQGLVDPSGRPAGKRFDVYRNNVVVSLKDAMETAFPVIHKLVGDAFFDAMSGIFVRQYPPRSPLLMFYGQDLPTFLADFEHAKPLPYLADVARLELARRDSYHAADATPIAPDALASLAPDDLMACTLHLAPHLELVQSPYPVVGIWEMNMIEGAQPPEPVAQNAFIARPELDVVMFGISDATFAFINALKINNFGQAFEKAIEIDEKFDLSAAIGLLIGNNTITKIEL